MATLASIERRKFRNQLSKRIKANSTGRVSAGICKQLAFTRTQAAVKQYEQQRSNSLSIAATPVEDLP